MRGTFINPAEQPIKRPAGKSQLWDGLPAAPKLGHGHQMKCVFRPPIFWRYLDGSYNFAFHQRVKGLGFGNLSAAQNRCILGFFRRDR